MKGIFTEKEMSINHEKMCMLTSSQKMQIEAVMGYCYHLSDQQKLGKGERTYSVLEVDWRNGLSCVAGAGSVIGISLLETARRNLSYF